MARAGLSRDSVIAAAATLLDRKGRGSLSLALVAASLKVRAPSLYNHVESLDDLERGVALHGIDRLAETCRSAVMGRSGRDALRAMARAYRDFAVAHPGIYALTQVARPRDREFEAKAARLLEPLTAILAGLGVPPSEFVHAARSLRSALHGFALLETGSGFGLDVDLEESFEWMLHALERGFATGRKRAATT